MYTLFLTTEIKEYFKTNFSKYEVGFNDNNLQNLYSGSTKTNNNFEVKVYKTGTITISGSYKERIYETLFKLINEHNYVGYDEVGVGDFFGPTVYVSTLLTKDSIDILSSLHLPIKDSKKLSDEDVLLIFDKIKKIVTYKSQIVFDKDINNLNSVAQKVKYHNLNIINEGNTHVVDLFTTINAFNKYKNELNLVYPNNLILETKADSKYYCVAISSIIARALFIFEMNKLVDKYDFDFKYGANVKNQAEEFVKLYSKDELAKFCKTSFKTFSEL